MTDYQYILVERDERVGIATLNSTQGTQRAQNRSRERTCYCVRGV